MSNPKLILIYGAGSGFGKSTLGYKLTDCLVNLGKSVDFFEEHDIAKMKEMQPYVGQVKAGRGDDAQTLINCCKKLSLTLAQNESEFIILDSLLPCWDWLAAAECPQDEIDQFTTNLCEAIKSFSPLLVLIEGDLTQALARAVSDRGEEWGLTLAEKRMGERSLEALVQFFVILRDVSNRTLPFWGFDLLRVNTIDNSIDATVNLIIEKVIR